MLCGATWGPGTHACHKQASYPKDRTHAAASPMLKCLRMFAAHPSQSITTTQCLSGRIGAYSQLPRMLHGPGPSALCGRKMPMLTAASARSKGAAPASSPSPARGEHRNNQATRRQITAHTKLAIAIPQGETHIETTDTSAHHLPKPCTARAPHAMGCGGKACVQGHGQQKNTRMPQLHRMRGAMA